MLKYRTVHALYRMFSTPLLQQVPSPTLVVDVEVWPGPPVVVDPVVGHQRDITMTHERLSQGVDAVVGVFQLLFHRVSVWIPVPVNLPPQHVEAV